MDLDDDVLNQFTAASNHSEMLSTNPMYYDDVAEIIPYEDYDHSRVSFSFFYQFLNISPIRNRIFTRPG